MSAPVSSAAEDVPDVQALRWGEPRLRGQTVSDGLEAAHGGEAARRAAHGDSIAGQKEGDALASGHLRGEGHHQHGGADSAQSGAGEHKGRDKKHHGDDRAAAFDGIDHLLGQLFQRSVFLTNSEKDGDGH